MTARKMLVLTLDPPFELSWAEQDAIIHHCLWSRDDNPSLLKWLEAVPGDQLLIHIAGKQIKPDVLELDMEHLTVVRRVGPPHSVPALDEFEVAEGGDEYDHLVDGIDFEALTDEGFEFTLQLSRMEAIHIVKERSSVSPLQIRNALNVYVDVMRPRFDGEPFVHLTVGKRALPIMVRLSEF